MLKKIEIPKVDIQNLTGKECEGCFYLIATTGCICRSFDDYECDEFNEDGELIKSYIFKSE